ncbi:MAG TPA: class I SAM-dependent methyltransferase [Acidimicrobiales bacterium]|nr:class I SAM-dependent methyltransferase [Acidimicrobiales bacterium]
MLEIGPGHAPFPTAPDATVTYCDRSVAGGRDANWPELAGQPHGPEAHLQRDLDRDGLQGVGDGSFDAVVASHLIEHLANPVAALCEFERVLRPGGRLVLIVPDRTRTFDAVRQPTPVDHVFGDYERRVTEVDDDHIREFCAAIYHQPPIHPDEVRQWHDPDRLDAERMALHRRRSIHVHCWTPPEFAALIAMGLARGVMSWNLCDLYLADDPGDQPDNEFGLVLERPSDALDPAARSAAFVDAWARNVLGRPDREASRAAAAVVALGGALHGPPELAPALAALQACLGEELAATRARAAAATERAVAAEGRVEGLVRRAAEAEAARRAIVASRSYRVSRLLAGALRRARGR